MNTKKYAAVQKQDTADAIGIEVARRIGEETGAEVSILFGSRARGNHRPDSDIDIILIGEKKPKAGELREKALRIAAETAGTELECDVLWHTPLDFAARRRYENSLQTKAIRYGVIMPRDPEGYSSHKYEDDHVEEQHDWSQYEERLRHGEIHLDDFLFMAEHGREGISQGQKAQKALEHSLKALIYAAKGEPEQTHDIGTLVGTARRLEALEREFRIGIDPDVYSANEWQEYRWEAAMEEGRIQELTSIENYVEITEKAVKYIIELAKAVREKSD